MRTPESISRPRGEQRGVYRAYLGLKTFFLLLLNFCATKRALGPLIRTTAIPLIPAGVARDAIVELKLEERVLTEEITPSL